MAARRFTRLSLGRIVGVSGLQGWLRIDSGTRPNEAIGRYPVWQLGKGDDWREHRVEQVKPRGKRIVGKLVGCDTREAAESLIGLEIAIHPQQLAKLPDDQYYWGRFAGPASRRLPHWRIWYDSADF